MISEITAAVPKDSFVTILLAIFLIGYFTYKEWPEFKKRMQTPAVRTAEEVQFQQDMTEKLESIEKQIGRLNEKTNNDFYRLENLESGMSDIKTSVGHSLEERELIMNALIGVLRGLQELGSNGPTKQSEHELMEFLNNRAHDQNEHSK